MKKLEILEMYLESCLGVVGERKDISCEIVKSPEAICLTRKMRTKDGKTYNLELTYTPEEFLTKPDRKKMQNSVDINVGRLLYKLINPQSEF
jgi:hypothetical protein